MDETKIVERPPKSYLRKFISGGVGGMCLVIVGHPLDTIKVRLQTMPLPAPGQPPMYTGIYDCLQKSMATNGIRGLYQGVGAPLLGSSPMYAMCFMGYELGKRLQRTDGKPLTDKQIAIAGIVAGIFTAPIMGPVDRVKCLLQIQDRPGALKFDGLRDCLSYLYRTGGIRSVYRGTLMTMVMEMPGCAAYFGTYEYLTREIEQGTSSFSRIMMAGGLAGVVCWCVAFPFDVIKSRRQTAPDGKFAEHSFVWKFVFRYSGIMDVVRDAVRTEGYRVFFRGLTPVILRAFPANAAWRCNVPRI